MADSTRGHRGGGRGAGGRGGRGGAGGHHRGGRGGAGGAGGEGGAERSERPKKENILDLSRYQDKEIRVKFAGGREGESCFFYSPLPPSPFPSPPLGDGVWYFFSGQASRLPTSLREANVLC